MAESNKPPDFYGILGVAPDATPREIKARFRLLARDRHPDRFHGREKIRAEKDFQAITEAFNLLTDPLRRRQHDLDVRNAAAPKRKSDENEIVRVYMNRGIRAYKQGRYIEAADNFDRATQQDPDNPQAWHHLALTCAKEERWWTRAQEAIVQACELRPNHPPYLKLAGKIFAASGMTSRAKQYYNQVLRQAGSDPAVRKALDALQDDPEKAPAKRPGLFRKIW